MCGITGFFSRSGVTGSAPLLEGACESLHHRGPDGGGAWVSPDGRVGLAMRRLAIIDVAGGRQPIFNEDGTVGIVFNGEIYNFEVLRKELEAKGTGLKTHSDTETIVHLYEEEGVECVRRLRGCSAFPCGTRNASGCF
ncbi:MAG: hypothetical protein IPP35_12150 [Elusimicrobia bacterium]|nr:hypothetical protein [Elusimicrobiota bacterium]